MVQQFLAFLLILGGTSLGTIAAVKAADNGAPMPPAATTEPTPAPDSCYEGSGLEALNACDRALTLAPNDASLWTIRGAILHEQLKRTAEALESHDRAIALAPAYTLALYNRCVVLIALERYPEAVESCDRALKGDGRWGQASPARALMNQGVALRRLRRYQEALAAYDLALESQPDYALAWNNRGVVLLDLGRNAEAETAFSRALELDPNNSLARRNLDIVRQRQQATP
ncbi:tetratricopeptide repeat protein [Oscillatoria sp. FACHB-1406]|uniref:tetratricopeptide repeat protein n=1 Tax=Oscillatoria sp. FACHB-1406 TaxID=2692846 RepID=UPI0016847F0C|nr:tetratricopeptide repeat protein [Oscillatoria sp. FACHB-1406]MBD2579252.1 tetratricopeptide repeat protein [Oscillatoria sp. FACHB-1406]